MPEIHHLPPTTMKDHLYAFWRGWVKPIGIVIILLSTFRSAIADWNDVPSGSMLPTIQIGDRIVVNKLAYGFHLPFTGPKMGIPFTKIEWDNPLHCDPLVTWNMPNRGDIITFWSPEVDVRTGEKPGTRLVKRVVAVAGDKLQWTEDSRLIITAPDGQRYEASYDNPQFARVYIKDERGHEARPDVIQYDETIAGSTRKVYVARDPNYTSLRPFPGHSRSHQVTGETYTVPEGCVWAMGDNRDFSGDSRKAGLGPVPVENITGRVFGVAFSVDTENGWAVRWSRVARAMD